jgi:hypothetical protein
MTDHPREKMEQRVIRKDDGRYLIMYSFKPAGPKAPAPDKGDSSQ